MKPSSEPNGNDADQPRMAATRSERRRASGRRADDLVPAHATTPTWSLRELYRALSRYRKRSIAFAVTVMTLAGVAVALAPPQYMSEARLFIRLGRESVALDPTATTGTVVGANVSRETEINSIIEVMTSRSLIEKVAAAIGLNPEPQNEIERGRAVSGLQQAIAVRSPKGTNVLRVSASAGSPERAQKIVAAVVENYLAEHLRLNSTPGSYEFFDEQTKLLKQRLDDASEALRKAKTEFNITSVEGRRDDLQRQVNTVETGILDAQSALAASAAKTGAMREELDRLPQPLVTMMATPSGNGNSGSDLRQKLYQLKANEQDLLSTFSEKHPDVIALRRQIREAERLVQTELPNRAEATSATLLNEQSNQKALSVRLETMKQQKERLHAALGDLARQEVSVKELERQVQVAETSYLTYVSSLEQTRVDQALKRNQISNINVIQPASLCWSQPVRISS